MSGECRHFLVLHPGFRVFGHLPGAAAGRGAAAHGPRTALEGHHQRQQLVGRQQAPGRVHARCRGTGAVFHV